MLPNVAAKATAATKPFIFGPPLRNADFQPDMLARLISPRWLLIPTSGSKVFCQARSKPHALGGNNGAKKNRMPQPGTH